MIRVTHSIAIDEDELEERSSAPPARAARTSTSCRAPCSCASTSADHPTFPTTSATRLERLAGSRLTRDGILIISAQRHRTQERNRADARDRLFELIRRAAIAPIPRRATKPTAGSRERRLQSKKRRSSIKGLRQEASRLWSRRMRRCTLAGASDGAARVSGSILRCSRRRARTRSPISIAASRSPSWWASRPGGSSSLYAQALARHMGRYLPGRPNFIVQHVPGAAASSPPTPSITPRRATAPRSRSPAAPWRSSRSSATPTRNSTAAKFTWIGTANVEVHHLHRLAHRPREDARRPDDTRADRRRLRRGRDRGRVPESRQQARRHENSRSCSAIRARPTSCSRWSAARSKGYCGIGWTFLKLRKADWLRDKKINILFQMSPSKHPELPDVPDHGLRQDARRPQGVRVPVRAAGDGPAVLCAARRAGRARTRAARCLRAHAQGPAFLADADKLGVEVQHVGGEAIERLVERIYASPKEVIARAKAVAE